MNFQEWQNNFDKEKNARKIVIFFIVSSPLANAMLYIFSLLMSFDDLL